MIRVITSKKAMEEINDIESKKDRRALLLLDESDTDKSQFSTSFSCGKNCYGNIKEIINFIEMYRFKKEIFMIINSENKFLRPIFYAIQEFYYEMKRFDIGELTSRKEQDLYMGSLKQIRELKGLT